MGVTPKLPRGCAMVTAEMHDGFAKEDGEASDRRCARQGAI